MGRNKGARERKHNRKRKFENAHPSIKEEACGMAVGDAAKPTLPDEFDDPSKSVIGTDQPNEKATHINTVFATDGDHIDRNNDLTNEILNTVTPTDGQARDLFSHSVLLKNLLLEGIPATGQHSAPTDPVQRQKAVTDDVLKCLFPARRYISRNHPVDVFPGNSCDGSDRGPSKAGSKSTICPTNRRMMMNMFPTTLPLITITFPEEVPTTTPHRKYAKEVSL